MSIVVGDGGVCKTPDADQLLWITLNAGIAANIVFEEPPKIAMLSFSTNGSGGKDASIDKIRKVIPQVRETFPEFLIDGEMQLDAAVVPEIGKKKMPRSKVAGQANVLICPDLNSGNILYKGLEHLGGWTMAGPILFGFDHPIADLSRGSSVKDIELTIKILLDLCEWKEYMQREEVL